MFIALGLTIAVLQRHLSWGVQEVKKEPFSEKLLKFERKKENKGIL